MPDDHSKLVPPLPIPNRTVKRLRADDSAATSVKVGYRQATILKTPDHDWPGVFLFVGRLIRSVSQQRPNHLLSGVVLQRESVWPAAPSSWRQRVANRR